MKKEEVVGQVTVLDSLIEDETKRLKAQQENPNLPDPADADVFTVKRITPVTPAAVDQSVKVLVRNGALRNLKAKNLADETDAKANIAEAKEKKYEHSAI